MSRGTKKVLIVAYYFPPHGTVGALRPLGFCRYLHEHGWLPQVISTDAQSVYPPCPTDEGLSRLLSEGLSVERIPYVSRSQTVLGLKDRFRRLLHSAPMDQAFAGNSAIPVNGDHSKIVSESGIQSFKRFLLDWTLDFPDPQNSWFPAVVRQWTHARRDDSPDLVFATGSPWTGLLVGRELARRLQLPFVADFRDPWASDHVHGFSSKLLNEKARTLEGAVCSSAEAIVANTEELRLEYMSRYPHLAGKFETITNGYNFEGESRQAIGTKSERGEGVFELCHFGNVYGDRNVRVFLQAVAELERERRLDSKRFRIRFVGTWDITDHESQSLAKQLEQEGLFRREAPIPHHLCLKEMASATALLIMQPHSNVRVPAKTYEYIASGRPIILIGDEGAASHLIERHRLGKWCRDSIPAIKNMLLSMLDGTAPIDPPAKEDVQRFDYKVLTGQLAGLFDRIVSENS
jgi:glycosyltransferase involved in cell wall biosynthesis